MYNYNVINPVNIHYRKYPQNDGAKGAVDSDEQSFQKPLTTDEDGTQRRFPNGNKVAIDYTKNQVNISQVLEDFRSTISAINSPETVADEVESYLTLVGKESEKEEPSREIVLSNLKNAARITDKYIQDSLKKPSRVVQDWVDALFLQNVNLKADSTQINEEFRVKIPDRKTSSNNIPQKTSPETSNEQVQSAYKAYSPVSSETKAHKGGLVPLNQDTVSFTGANEIKQQEEEYQYQTQNSFIESSYEAAPVEFETVSYNEPLNAAQTFEEVQQEPYTDYYGEIEYMAENSPTISAFEEYDDPYAARTENEALAREVLIQGKASFEDDNGDIYSTLKLYDEALSLVEGSSNTDLKSAIYFERGKVFDSYDYPELALIDYNKATKSNDGNLRAQAHIKMGNIYDDYVQFDPAMDQYTMAIEDSEEVNNLQGKTKALRCMASMFAGIYDSENTDNFSSLAIESAKETENPGIIAKTYLEAAENYKYTGQDSKALQAYSALAQETSVQDDYDSLAQNYMLAAELMDKKGNKQKSYALMLKSKEYQRMARLRRAVLEES